MRIYSNSDSPYLPPKYTSKNSTLQTPKKTHPNNIDDIKSSQIPQDYELLKLYSVELFRCFITDIRSLRFNSEVVLFQVC